MIAPDLGALALAFVNSWSRDGDLIATPGRLQAWLSDHPDPDGASAAVPLSPPLLRAMHDEALALRAELRALFAARSAERPPPPRALFAVNRVLAVSRRSERLVPTRRRYAVRVVEHATTALAALVPVARSAATLLRDAPGDRLRVCAADDCPEWFLDTSKAGRRRWCSMATCGNRAKAARHRARASDPG